MLHESLPDDSMYQCMKSACTSNDGMDQKSA